MDAEADNASLLLPYAGVDRGPDEFPVPRVMPSSETDLKTD